MLTIFNFYVVTCGIQAFIRFFTFCSTIMNSLNDILFVGGLHNKGLFEATKLSGFPKVTVQQVDELSRTIIKDYYAANNLGDFVQLSTDVIVSRVSQLQEYSNNFEGYLSALKEEGLINDVQRNLGEQLATFGREISSPSELEAKLIDWEQQQYAELGFDVSYPVLGASVIARHSSWFWYEATTNDKDPWHPVVGSQPQARLLKFLADVGGFIGGAVLGNGICGPACGVAGGTLLGTAASANVTEKG